MSAEWWDSYGDDYPELKKFAIRILSLTCSSSSCERNWSVFEMVRPNDLGILWQDDFPFSFSVKSLFLPPSPLFENSQLKLLQL